MVRRGQPGLAPALVMFAAWHKWISLAALAVTAAGLLPSLRSGNRAAQAFIAVWAITTVALFFVPSLSQLRPSRLALVLAWRHEPWRDELTPWRIAHAHADYGDFLAIIDWGGHPRLWHSAVWLLAQLGDDHRLVQGFQLAVAVAAAWLAARFAPFSRPARTALVLGYYPLFEYGVISREYVLGLVMLFAFCAAYAAGASVLTLALLAGVLAQTSAYGLMLALALVATIVIEKTFRRGTGDPPVQMAQHGRVAHAT